MGYAYEVQQYIFQGYEYSKAIDAVVYDNNLNAEEERELIAECSEYCHID